MKVRQSVTVDPEEIQKFYQMVLVTGAAQVKVTLYFIPVVVMYGKVPDKAGYNLL